MSEPTQFQNGLRQIVDLTGNDRVTREVVVTEVDPVTGVPSKTVEGKPDPFAVVPVQRAGGEAVVMAPGLCIEPGARIVAGGNLVQPTQAAGHSTIVQTTEKPAPGAQTTLRGEGEPYPADQGLLNQSLRVLHGELAILGHDGREPQGPTGAGGGALAWSESPPGGPPEPATALTRIGETWGPMRQGSGTPFSDPERTESRITDPSGARVESDVTQGGAGGSGGAGGQGAAGGGGSNPPAAARIERQPDGRLRAVDADGNALDGIVFYRDRHGGTRWLDSGTGRTGTVREVIPVGIQGGSAGSFPSLVNPDGTITVGIRGGGTPAGAQVARPGGTARLASPQTFRLPGGRTFVAVAVRRTPGGGLVLVDAEGAEAPASTVGVTEDRDGNVLARDPTTGRSVYLGNTRGVVTLGLGGGIRTQRDPVTGEVTIVAGTIPGRRSASVSAVIYPVGSTEYVSVVQRAQAELARLSAEDQGEGPPRGGAGGPGGRGGELSPEARAVRERYAQDLRDVVRDGQLGLPLGSSRAERLEREAAERGEAAAAEEAARPRVTGVQISTLFGLYNDIGFPIAFDAPLVERAHDVFARGPRWAAGYEMEIGGYWRPVVPVPETIPPAPPRPPDEPREPPKKPPEGKKEGPPPDGESAGGRGKDPQDGELMPCDGAFGHPGEPGHVPGGGGGDGPGGGTPEPGETIPTLLSVAPGTAGARAHPLAGRSAIQPQLPPMDPQGDERQRLGGGPYQRGAPLVPRGGIRLLDPFDFNETHTVWDVLNRLIDDRNALVSLVNERFPFAPDAVEGAGLKLPRIDPEDPRLEQRDAGTVVMVGVEDPSTREVLDVPHVVVKDRRGEKALVPITPDSANQRELGAGIRGEDVLLRFATGRPGRANRGKVGDAQPKWGYDGAQDVFFVAGIPFQVRSDLILVGPDGTEWKASSDADGVLSLTSSKSGSVITFPDATGTVGIVAGGAGTLNVLPRFGAGPTLVDSGLLDDGGALGTSRTLLRLGTQAASASFPALKRSGTEAQVRLADDSGFAALRASLLRTGDGSAGVKTIDFLNAVGRSQLAWNPTAERNLALPDIDGTTLGAASLTNGTLPRGTATAGVVQDSGVTDDGSTIGLTRNTTVSSGKKLTATPDEVTAGLNLGQAAGDPSTLANGDVWGRSGANQPRYRKNGATVALETQDNRNVANGYAGLDGSARIVKVQGHAATVYNDQANTYGAGLKQVVTPDATRAGLNLGTPSADPSTLADGDVWGRSGANQPRYRKNGATVSLETQDQKGAASGYASLDSGTKVPTVQLGGSGADATKFLRGDQTWAAAGGGADVMVAMSLVTAFFGMGPFGGR